jgi:hypothetical protein
MPKPIKTTEYKTGRPPLDLNPEEVVQVEKLAAYLNQSQIAAILGISDDTFRRIMRVNDSVSMAYKRGRASKVNLVAESLFKMATNEKNPNVIAALFYLKARGGWVESQPEVEQQTINITYAPTQGRVEKEVFSPAPESIDHAPEQG